nr:Na+/H+ antiporter NhaA [Luteolibacter flavescens]
MIRAFFSMESASGLILMAVAAMALVVANSAFAPSYFGILNSYAGGLSILHWINDGLMAVFFLLVGLEIKRELLEGELSTWQRRALPGFAALGGMIVPGAVYYACNLAEGGQARGWAIPTATDIAFALGVLALLGSRAPVSLKIFLTALAIIDDLGAVLIIAIFYTNEIDLRFLGGAAATLGVLGLLNYRNVTWLSIYCALGIVLWACLLKSGVHATLAGVLLALTIPLRLSAQATIQPPLKRLEHSIHPFVGFLVIPIFGFANAGVSLTGFSLPALGEPVSLGVALGLFAGKQVGVFLASAIAIKAGIARLPDGANWRQLYGVCALCGIGFTMSLFIGLLAFDAPDIQNQVKLGVMIGSAASAILGAALLIPKRGTDFKLR